MVLYSVTAVIAVDVGQLYIVLFGVNSHVQIWSVNEYVNLSPFSATPFFLFLSLFQSRELVKAYPPFVNFFEMSKETIVRCEKQKPRFHAFLKVGKPSQSSARLNQSINFFCAHSDLYV